MSRAPTPVTASGTGSSRRENVALHRLTFGRLRNFGRVDTQQSTADSTALVLVYGLLVTSSLAPGFGPLTVPAIVYAGDHGDDGLDDPRGLRAAVFLMGAILFIISGFADRRRALTTGGSWAAYLIWPTYYLGQHGIAVGFAREAAGDDGDAPHSRSTTTTAAGSR